MYVNYSLFSAAPPEIEIGCFNGNPLKEVLGDLTNEVDWEHTDVVERKCAQLAHDKGYKYFALGNNGICYSGAKAQTEYFSQGVASQLDCMNGIGRDNHIFVYTLGEYTNSLITRLNQVRRVGESSKVEPDGKTPLYCFCCWKATLH